MLNFIYFYIMYKIVTCLSALSTKKNFGGAKLSKFHTIQANNRQACLFLLFLNDLKNGGGSTFYCFLNVC